MDKSNKPIPQSVPDTRNGHSDELAVLEGIPSLPESNETVTIEEVHSFVSAVLCLSQMTSKRAMGIRGLEFRKRFDKKAEEVATWASRLMAQFQTKRFRKTFHDIRYYLTRDFDGLGLEHASIVKHRLRELAVKLKGMAEEESFKKQKSSLATLDDTGKGTSHVSRRANDASQPAAKEPTYEADMAEDGQGENTAQSQGQIDKWLDEIIPALNVQDDGPWCTTVVAAGETHISDKALRTARSQKERFRYRHSNGAVGIDAHSYWWRREPESQHILYYKPSLSDDFGHKDASPAQPLRATGTRL